MPQGYFFNTPAEAGRFYEKRDIKRAGNSIGLAFILSNCVAIGLQLVLLLLYELAYALDLPAAGFLAEIIAGNTGQWVQQILLSAAMFTLPFLVVARGTGRRTADIIQAKKVRPGLFIALVVMALGFCAIGDIMSIIANTVWSMFTGREMASPDFTMPADNIYGMLIFAVAVSVVPPLVEEFALRGVVLGALRRHGGVFAVIVSAMFFGLMHGNLQQGIFAFFTGIGLGLCVIVSDSVWPAIAAHFINNFYSTALQFLLTEDIGGRYMRYDLAETLVGGMDLVYIFGFAAAGIAAFVYIWSKYKYKILQKPNSTMTSGQRAGSFFSSPGVIIALVIFLLTMIAYEFLF